MLRRVIPRVIVLALLGSLILPELAGAAAPPPNIVGMEEYMVSRINRGRDNVDGDNPNPGVNPSHVAYGGQLPYAFHGCIVSPPDPGCVPQTNPEGLRATARAHTASMAAAAALNPVVTSGEIGSATPDP